MTRFRPSLPLFVLLVLFLLSFLAMEWRHPYFFLQDDNRVQNLPLYVHAYRALLFGELAHYSFWQLLGTPVLSTMQAGVLYPVNYVAVFLSKTFFGHFFATMEFAGFIHLLGAACAFYALARFLGLSGWAAAFGGYGWAFCGFVTCLGNSWMQVTSTAAFLPFMMLLSLRMLKRPSWPLFLGWSAARAFFFFAGHPQYFLYSFLFEALFVGAVALPGGGLAGGQTPWRRFAALCAGHLALTTLFAAPLLLPAARQVAASADRQLPMSWARFSSNSIDLGIWLRGLFLPTTDSAYAENIFNVVFICHFGYAALFCAVAGLAFSRGASPAVRRAAYACAAGGLLALFYACDLFYVARLAYALPVIDRFRWLFKTIFFVSFSMLFLASVGFDRLERRAASLSGRAGRLAAAGLAFLFAAQVADLLIMNTLEEQRRLGRHYDAVPLVEPLAEKLTDGRVVSVGFECVTNEGIRGYTAPSLGFNYATLWEVMQFGGYEILSSVRHKEESLDAYLLGTLPTREALSLREGANGFPHEHFRRWGVRWFVIDRAVDLVDKGDFRIAASDERRILFYDAKALPIVYADRGAEVEAIPYLVGTNRIAFETTLAAATPVRVNVLFSPYFKGYLDGAEVPVRETSDSQVEVSLPPGRHAFELVYVDPLFRLGLALAGAGAALFAGAWFFAARFRGRAPKPSTFSGVSDGET